VVFGPIANLIAAGVIFMFRKYHFTACVVGALPIGFIVGGYLWVFFPSPELLNALPVWLAMIVSITVSSLITVAVIGYLLLSVLSRPSIIEPLKSKGLRVVAEGK
jgi:predicted membrane protein